jgi:MFS transporter, FSR family, fosmidomycin resistance protein
VYATQRLNGCASAGTAALFVLYLGGAVAGVVFVPGPALYVFVALTSAGLYVPFSLQVTLAHDYLPSRLGTAWS